MVPFSWLKTNRFPDFGRLVNPIPTRPKGEGGGSADYAFHITICPSPPPLIFKPSYGPVVMFLLRYYFSPDILVFLNNIAVLECYFKSEHPLSQLTYK